MFKSKEGFATPTPSLAVTLLTNNFTQSHLGYFNICYYSGAIYVPWGASVYKITPNNPTALLIASIADTNNITAVAIDSSGYIYVSTSLTIYKSWTPGNAPLIRYAGIASTGSVNSDRLLSSFNNIMSMVFDSNGDMFIADMNNHCIRKITTSTGMVTKFAGTTSGYTNGPGNIAKFSYPLGLAIDSSNQLYVTDTGNGLIRKITTSGAVSTYAGKNPSADNRYISGYLYGAGIGWTGFTSVQYVTIDSTGTLYVSDSMQIRKINTLNQVTTINTGLTAAIYAITIDPTGVIYIISSRKFYTLNLSCPAGYKLEGNICNACPTGTWSSAGAIACTSCPANTTTALTTRTSASQCTSASAGYYMSGTTPVACPSNATCPGGTASFSCIAGYKKNAAGTGCELCPIGTYSAAGATVCTACPANRTTSTTGSTLLSQCIASTGFYMSGSTVTACPANTTTPSTGGTTSNDCSIVNPGYYMNGTTVTQCPANTSCPGGSRTTTTTFTCANGYKTNTAGTACEQCGIGFYGTGGICSVCPANTTTSSTGSTLLSQCIAAAGYFLSGGTLQSCPANTTTTSSGSTSQNQCTSASAGYYISGGTAMLCPSNATCPGGTASFSCIAGYKKNVAGTGCEECGLGTWSSAGATSCTSCPPNTTTSLTARTSSNQCTSATAGYYMNNGAVTSCPSNANCVGGSSSFLCSNGYETNGSSCVSCGVGFYGTGGTCVSCSTLAATDSTSTWTTRTTGQTSCTPLECKPNYRMNALSNNCEPCPPNTRGLNCTSVSPGYYMNNGVVTSCPSNAFCSGELATFVCSNGYETSGSSCVSCGVGFYGTGGRCVPCSSLAATDSTSTWTTRAIGQTSCIADTCKNNFKLNEVSSNCEPCPPNTRGSNCTSALAGYYMNNGVPILCPSNASCDGSSSLFSCSNDYIMNAGSNACDPCPAGSEGPNCTTILAGYYKNGSRTLPCPSNANCEGGSNIFVCSNDYIMNAGSNECDPCPAGSKGPNCTTILAGYYNNGSRTLLCPSNARCDGGSTSFVCSNDYIMNAGSNACDPCPAGSKGLNCTEASPGYYLNEGRTVSCPSNAICTGGTGFFTCSNGYFVNYRSGTCDVVTTIVQPGSSQLLNTRGIPTIAETTACTPSECTLLFKDPLTGEMLPINPCISEDNYYDFATKKCINKCCLISMSNAKNDVKCKYNVRSTPPIKNTALCPPNSRNLCCRNNVLANNTSCRNFWTPGVDSWTPEHIRTCAAGFTDYGIDSIFEKRRKWREIA